MTVIPAAATPAAKSPTKGESTPENPNGELGKSDFLKLMVAQLQAQDPLQPTGGTEYIAELAQFSTLEQMTNIDQATTSTETAQQVSQSVQLIGHTVSYTDSTGKSVEGKVESVQVTSSGATLTVEGKEGVEPSKITEVK